jgi:Raf kinase inhibitor-like YbhB/YbcL family protein
MRINAGQSIALLAFLLCTVASAQQSPPPSKFKLSSPAFSEGSQIPTRYTCAASSFVSPPLEWSDPPANTASFALIFHDTDAAPRKNSMDVTHWIVWNVPGSSTELQADIKPDTSPQGIRQGKNIRGVNGYQGPCPPPGATPHHYVFELYALDQQLDLPAGSTRTELLDAMNGHVIGKATDVARFGR